MYYNLLTFVKIVAGFIMGKNSKYLSSLIVVIFIGLSAGLISAPVNAAGLLQIPTVDVATVTSTPIGAIITVRSDIDQDYINIRNGPNTTYDKVGLLYKGQTAPALGWSVGKKYIQIVYPGVEGGVGWVFAPYVTLSSGASLPIIEASLDPTPSITKTIDPTLAAQYIITPLPSRQPTFTAPPPLSIPTYQDYSSEGGYGGVPMGLVIIALLAVGLFFMLFSVVQGK